MLENCFALRIVGLCICVVLVPLAEYFQNFLSRLPPLAQISWALPTSELTTSQSYSQLLAPLFVLARELTNDQAKRLKLIWMLAYIGQTDRGALIVGLFLAGILAISPLENHPESFLNSLSSHFESHLNKKLFSISFHPSTVFYILCA